LKFKKVIFIKIRGKPLKQLNPHFFALVP
jgi:hypothetical protein